MQLIKLYEWSRTYVYAIKGYGKYCAGMAVVAAKTPEEAKELCKSINTQFSVDYQKTEDVEILDIDYNGESKILTIFEYGE